MSTTPAHDEHDEWAAVDGHPEERGLRILLYSDHVQTRQDVRLAVGRRIAKDLPPVTWVEVATHTAVLDEVGAGGVDLLVLDGEAGKTGGLGVCRQLKDEVFRCPPVLVVIGRPQDAWLASWSGAEAVVTQPLDPIVVHQAVESLVRERVAAG